MEISQNILDKGLLSELAYLKLENSFWTTEIEGKTPSYSNLEDLKKFIEENNKDITGIAPERKDAILNILTKYTIDDFTTTESGMQAMVLIKNDGSEITVAFRGTETGDWLNAIIGDNETSKDIGSDAQMALGTETQQMKDALAFMKKVEDENGDIAPITITGHSLGGALAQYVAYKSETKYETYTFNGFGIKKGEGIIGTNADTSNIHNFHLGIDFVSGIGSEIGGQTGGEYLKNEYIFRYLPKNWLTEILNRLITPNNPIIAIKLNEKLNEYMGSFLGEVINITPYDTSTILDYGTDHFMSEVNDSLKQYITLSEIFKTTEIESINYDIAQLVAVPFDNFTGSIYETLKDSNGLPKALELMGFALLGKQLNDGTRYNKLSNTQEILTELKNLASENNGLTVFFDNNQTSEMLYESAKTSKAILYTIINGLPPVILNNEEADLYKTINSSSFSDIYIKDLSNMYYHMINDTLSLKLDANYINKETNIKLETLNDVPTVVFGQNDETIQETIYGQKTNDRLYGRKGDDIIKAGLGNDFLEGGEGNDTLYGDEGVDQLHGGSGKDIIYGGENSDYLYAGEGNDTLYGDEGNDFLYGEEGINYLYGGANDDYLEGGINEDFLYGGENDDVLYGREGDDYLEGNAGDDVLAGSEGNDTLKAGLGKDQLYGGKGNDILYATDGVNSLFGGDGNDTIYGEEGINTIEGGKGDDLLISGTKTDHFKFGSDDGNDIIEGFNDTDESLGIDTLIFEQKPDYYDYIKQGNNLIIKYSTNSSVTLKDYYVKNNKIQADENNSTPNYEKYEVEDDIYTIIADDKNDEIDVYDGDYKIYSNGGDDYIKAKNGDITIYSGKGNDNIYISGKGNRIVYAGEGNDKINIPYYGKNIIYGEKGNDHIYSAGADDTLYGGEGNDYISAGSGNDTLYGNQGNDTLHGENGDDIIYSGEGKNILDGGSGKDTFIIEKNAIYNEIQSYTSEDTLKFYVEDENSIEFFMKGSEFRIKYDDSKEILLSSYDSKLKNIFYNDKELIIDYVNLIDSSSSSSTTSSYAQQNYYDFSYIVDDITNTKDSKIYTGAKDDYIEAGKGDDTIYAYDSNDIIIGNQGDDILLGGKGDDSYIFYLNDGKDYIIDDEGYNTANFITDGNELKLYHINRDKSFSYDKEGSIVVKQDKDSFVFVSNYFKNDETGFGDILLNNRTLDFDTIYIMLTNYGDYKFYSELNYNYFSDPDSIVNNDSKITTASGDDNIITGDGDDTIYTNSGNDTIHAGAGDNEIYAGDGSNKIYTANGKNKIYADNGDNYVEVGDDIKLVKLGNGNNIIKGKNTAENSEILLGSGNNDIILEDGNYKIKIEGNTSSTNTLNLGENWSNIEVLNGKTTIYADNTSNGSVNLANGDDKVMIKDFTGDGYGTARIDVKDGNNYINLGNNWKSISAGSGDDLLFIKDFNLENIESNINFGAGNNELYIGNGAYNITTLEGEDFIIGGNGIKSISSGDGNDTISIQNDWGYITTGDGDNNIYAGNNTKDTFSSFLTVGNGNNEIEIGTYWNYMILGNGNNTVHAKQSLGGMIMTGDGNNSIRVTNEDNVNLEGLGVQVYAGSGNNTIQLGDGDDNINTGSGDDIFIFDINDGIDTIYDSSGTDKIQFLEDVNKTDLFFFKEDDNLIIDYGQNNSITIESQFNSYNQIERIELSEGSYLTNEDIESLIQNMIAFSEENEIDLTNRNEIKNKRPLNISCQSNTDRRNPITPELKF